jgi:hypothetical protein
MICACHQPNYLPWPGFFYKAFLSDYFVLLDSVQFPRGSSFVPRNRIKTPPENVLWLTIPVKRKGKGLQRINEVMIDNNQNWRRKHYLSIVHNYKKAPYFLDYIGFFDKLYNRKWEKLLDINMEIINHLLRELKLKKKIILSSKLGAKGKGTELLINITERVGADTYLSGHEAKKHLIEKNFRKRKISLKYYNFIPPIYPQLWGRFIRNLSILDLIMNYGKKSMDIIIRYSSKK